MRLVFRGACHGSPWEPTGRPTGIPVDSHDINCMNYRGTPRHATESHGIRCVCSWDPAGTIGITHGIPQDVVKKSRVPAMSQGNLTGSREVPRDPTESPGKSRGNPAYSTVMSITTVERGGFGWNRGNDYSVNSYLWCSVATIWMGLQNSAGFWQRLWPCAPTYVLIPWHR